MITKYLNSRYRRLLLATCLLAFSKASVDGRDLPSGNFTQQPEFQAQDQSGDQQGEAMTLLVRVQELINRGKYDEAQPLAERAVDLAKAELGPENLLFTAATSALGRVCLEKGDFARARKLFTDTLIIRQKVKPGSSFVALALNNLAIVDRSEGDFPLAEERLLEALRIYEKVSGVISADAALAQSNLSSLYFAKGDFSNARDSAQDSLSIRLKLFGEENLNVAASRTNLGLALQAKGDYVNAEPELLGAFTIRQKLLGKRHPEVVAALINLASLFQDRGDYKRAESMYVSGLEAFKRDNGETEENRFVATILGNLAGVYGITGRHDLSLKLHLNALAVSRRVLAAGDPDLATPLANAGVAYSAAGQYSKAKEIFTEAGETIARAFGQEHPSYAWIRGQLGYVAEQEGDYKRAEELYREALAIKRKMLGEGHPDVAALQADLARMFWKRGDVEHAVDYLTQANELVERNAVQILTMGSENQKRLYLRTLAAGMYRTISLHTSWAANKDAARLALTTILRRKGRALDVMSSEIRALRERSGPEDRALLDRFVSTRTRLATLTTTGPGKMKLDQYRELVNKVASESEELEREIGSRNSEFRFRLQVPQVTVDRIQQVIPPDAALIEFEIYQPYDQRARTPLLSFGDQRYVAYVLKREGAPVAVDLGPASKIDGAVREFRALLRQPSNQAVRGSGQILEGLVVRPLRKFIGPTRDLFISPDGPLNLIPFAALVDRNGKYLVEEFSISYLTSGRELLRPELPMQSRQPPIVFADPDFDLTLQQGIADRVPYDRSSPPTLNADFGGLHWVRLPGTTEVVQSFETIFPDSKVYVRERATETALKRVAGPSIIHIATHGFFRDDISKLNQPGSADENASAPFDNPLLRSGLVLAGANNLQGGDGEDGIITALEVSGLDLWGTKLVVLSACETGLGEVHNGEGVYGLRRALVLAGAESQVMSLWKVDDEVTRDLMVHYYKRLLVDQRGRSEALRLVQLEMIATKGKNNDDSHPYYWASFIESGNWKSLARN